MSDAPSPESPTTTAARLGLSYRKGKGAGTLTNDHLLDLAVSAYWRNRVTKTRATAKTVGKRSAVVLPDTGDAA